MNALLVLGLVPLIWSAAMVGARYALRRGREDVPHDLTEKYVLASMLAPVVVGAVSLCLATWLPPLAILPLPNYAGNDDFPLIVPQAAETFASQANIEWRVPALWPLATIYALGLLWRASRLVLGHARLRQVVVESVIAKGWGEEVRLTGAAVPAFAWRKATIIVPRNLIDTLSDAQMAMVIAHERGHLRRGDTFYYLLLSWIDVLFWFNPFVRYQTKRCRLAAELACDAQVTRELETVAVPDMRKAYAESLLLALKHTAGNTLPILTQSGVPTVISPSNSGEFRMRLTEIMRASGVGRKRIRRISQMAAVALMMPFLGGQFMLSQKPALASVAATITDASLFSVMPVKGEIVSPYGPRTNPLDGKPQVHGGIDFRADIGTTVYAPAVGHVVTVKTDSWNGLYMEIDHGGGYISRYTHLKELIVSDAAEVSAGQPIARVGNSGKSTGPHLHFAVFKDGQPIDPATVLPQVHTISAAS